MAFKILQGDCGQLLAEEHLSKIEFFRGVDLTFLDPPFNQDKYYANHSDNMPEEEYWDWMERVAEKVYHLTAAGGAIYFMQREKNTEYILRCLRASGWTFQNLIIWKKLTSAIPGSIRYGKHYQIIAFATKGRKPRVFNRLRIDPPLLPHQKYERDNGVYVTDVWDDIRELTSGYFAGDEPLRDKNGERFHKQQSPVGLLVRIILSSTKPSDLVLDPFSGTGTTSVVAEQLGRDSISIELDPINVKATENRLHNVREIDDISRFRPDYRYTKNLEDIWQDMSTVTDKTASKQQPEFFDF